jgi:hypothetical protein
MIAVCRGWAAFPITLSDYGWSVASAHVAAYVR